MEHIAKVCLFGQVVLMQNAEPVGTLSYNGRTGTLRTGRDAVDYYQIAGRLVQDTYRFVVPYHTATWPDYCISTKV